MNVGYIYGFNSFPPRDGGSIHVYNVVRQWSELGCRVHTVGRDDNPHCIVHPADADGVRTFLKSIDVLCMRIDGRMLMDDAIRIQCMREFAPRPIVWEINAPAEEMLSRFFFSRPAGRLSGLLALVRRHLWRRRVRREDAVRRRYGTDVHAAVCVSAALQTYARRDLGIRRCEIVPNGSDPTLFSPEQPSVEALKRFDGYFKIVYSGDSRWPWQGFDLIGELAARARREDRKILFVVLDSSPSTNIASTPNVQVFNGVPYFDVPAYLAGSDASLCLYRSFSWSRYGFHLSPLKLYDYMAAGKPIVASRLGQIAEVIDDGNDGLLAENIDEIYAKIVFCQDHPHLTKQMGEAARAKVVSFYNWRRVAATMLGVFESVMPERTNAREGSR